MKPLAIDLFCGLGGWTDGLIAAGYDVVGFDIQRHSYGEQRYPAQLVLQDILTVHGSQFRDATLIVTSPPCQAYSWLAMPWSRSKDPENSKAAKALRKKWETEGPDNRLFDACFRIQREANEANGVGPFGCLHCIGTGNFYGRDEDGDWLDCDECDGTGDAKKPYIPMVVENVRGAVPWVGPAKANYGSFYLWGDIAIVGNRIIAGDEWRWFSHGLKVPGRAAKTDGGSWFRERNGEPQPGIRHEGTKIGGDWFSDPNSTCRKHGSSSNARKAASAMIAKIPFPLAEYIGRAFLPTDMTGSLAQGARPRDAAGKD